MLAELKRIGKGSVDHRPVINEADHKKFYESIIMILDATLIYTRNDIVQTIEP